MRWIVYLCLWNERSLEETGTHLWSRLLFWAIGLALLGGAVLSVLQGNEFCTGGFIAFALVFIFEGITGYNPLF